MRIAVLSGGYCYYLRTGEKDSVVKFDLTGQSAPMEFFINDVGDWSCQLNNNNIVNDYSIPAIYKKLVDLEFEEEVL